MVSEQNIQCRNMENIPTWSLSRVFNVGINMENIPTWSLSRVFNVGINMENIPTWSLSRIFNVGIWRIFPHSL